MPWDKQYDETEVIEKAMRAFWAHGYTGTSVADLIAATGINRGSLYSAFDGKRRLFLTALRHYDKLHRRDFLARIELEHAPKDAIIEVFTLAAALRGNGTTPAGCLLVNTAIELAPHDEEVAGLVQSSFDDVEDFFKRMVERAKRERTVPQSLSASPAAKALLGLFLGLRVLARSNADPATRKTIIAQAHAMLE